MDIAVQSIDVITNRSFVFWLQLIKVQDNLLSGEVLYHKIVSKSPAEVLKTKKRLNARRKLKEKRKREQELNVKAKETEKEENKKRSLAGMEKKKTDSAEAEPSSKKIRPNEDDGDVDTEHSEDDDAEWYRREIGEEPESGEWICIFLAIPIWGRP